MSEAMFHQEDFEFEEQIETLDEAIRDPYLEAVFQDLEVVNGLIDDDVSMEEINKLIADLDSKFAPYFHAEVRVSGRLTINRLPGHTRRTVSDSRDVLVDIEKGLFYVDDLEGVAQGFYRGYREAPDGSQIDQHIFLGITNWGENGLRLLGIKNPQDVSLEVVDRMSGDMARHYLEALYPDLLVDLEERIMNSSNVAEAIMSLGSFEIDAVLFTDSEQAKQLTAAIDVYLCRHLPLDTEAPYFAHVDGFGVSLDGEGSTYGFKDNKLLLIQSSFMPVYVTTDDQPEGAFKLGAVANILSVNSKDTSDSICILLDAFKKLESVRETYYGGLSA